MSFSCFDFLADLMWFSLYRLFLSVKKIQCIKSNSLFMDTDSDLWVMEWADGQQLPVDLHDCKFWKYLYILHVYQGATVVKT